MPKSFAEKGEFREMLKSMNRVQDPDLYADNFEEAEGAVTECFKTEAMSDSVQMIFDMHGDMIEQSKEQFWVYCKCLKSFYEQHNRMPVQGTIPDMTSLPKYYVAL